MFEQVLIFVSVLWVMAKLGLTAADVVGANIYDVLQIRETKKANRRKTRSRYSPPVSIIIYAHNNAATIEQCFMSITDGNYKKYDVLVIDDASTDGTKRIIEKFIKAHPKAHIKLHSKRKAVGYDDALRKVRRQVPKNAELIMALDGGMQLQPHTLRDVTTYFSKRPVDILIPNIRIRPRPEILSLIQQFSYLSDFRSKKLASLMNVQMLTNQSGIAYRADLLKSGNGTLGRAVKTQYASDIVVLIEPQSSYRLLFKKWYQSTAGKLGRLSSFKVQSFADTLYVCITLTKYVTTRLQPLLLTYFLYLAVTHKSAILLIFSWMIISVWLLLAIWADEHFNLASKLRLTLFIPMMYVLFYIQHLVQLVMIGIARLNLKTFGVGAK